MSVFARHPRATLGVLVPLLLVATDLGFTASYQWVSGRLSREGPRLRVRSEIFHHGFAPKISVVAEHWGPRACLYRTNSLGFRKGMAIFTVAKGGLMYQATLGGQKYSFTPL